MPLTVYFLLFFTITICPFLKNTPLAVLPLLTLVLLMPVSVEGSRGSALRPAPIMLPSPRAMVVLPRRLPINSVVPVDVTSPLLVHDSTDTSPSARAELAAMPATYRSCPLTEPWLRQFFITVAASSPLITLPTMPPTFFTPLIEPLLVQPSMSTALVAQLTMPAVYCFDLDVPLVSSTLPLLVQYFMAPE